LDWNEILTKVFFLWSFQKNLFTSFEVNIGKFYLLVEEKLDAANFNGASMWAQECKLVSIEPTI